MKQVAKVMKINPIVPDLSKKDIEIKARKLIDQYQQQIALISTPPIPVDHIAEGLLNIRLDTKLIPNVDILAYINPEEKTIYFNESRKNHFETYFGTYEFTLAHELGHYELHCTNVAFEQLSFNLEDIKGVYCTPQIKVDIREYQANRFASYLLMPSYLLLPEIKNRNITWPVLRSLSQKFHVSVEAMKIRLKDFDRVYTDNGVLKDRLEVQKSLFS